MANPSCLDILTKLLNTGSITQQDFDLYKANYDFCKQYAALWLQNHPDVNWIASLNGKLFSGKSFAEVQTKIQNEPNIRYVYTEQL